MKRDPTRTSFRLLLSFSGYDLWLDVIMMQRPSLWYLSLFFFLSCISADKLIHSSSFLVLWILFFFFTRSRGWRMGAAKKWRRRPKSMSSAPKTGLDLQLHLDLLPAFSFPFVGPKGREEEVLYCLWLSCLWRYLFTSSLKPSFHAILCCFKSLFVKVFLSSSIPSAWPGGVEIIIMSDFLCCLPWRLPDSLGQLLRLLFIMNHGH